MGGIRRLLDRATIRQDARNLEWVPRMLKTSIHILILAASLWAAWAASGDRVPIEKNADDREAVQPQDLPMRPIEFGAQFRGMAVQLHGGEGAYDHYRRLIPEIAELGADTVLFVVHGWQTHAGSLDLHVDVQKTPSNEDLGKLLDLAAAHGLRRMVMPIVLLKSPRKNEWRGKIIPPDHNWKAWFARYRRFVLRFARVAAQHNAEMLVVGSELIKSESKTGLWRETIAAVREEYDGALCYSANWDHYQTTKIRFWDELDYVGMTSYYQLADGPRPKMAEIDENWNRIKKEILAFQREVKKPIVFTEVGWCSQEGAAKEGWNYYATDKATKAGHLEQAMLYESFMKAWTNEPAVGGIIWWEWTTAQGGAEDISYSPRGKVSEALLRFWLADRPRPDLSVSANPRRPR